MTMESADVTVQHGWRRWLVLAAFSLMLFLITASTYSSLGVVLPHMVAEMGWDWTPAGLGFTLLGVFTGASSLLPAIVIRRAGVRAAILLGSAVMGCGFLLLATTGGLLGYFAGAALCGVGYQMTALVPGTHVLGALFTNKTRIFGFYFTFGSLGGVAGPWMVMAILGDGAAPDWRFFWMIQAMLAVGFGVACAIAVGSRAWLAQATVPEIPEEKSEENSVSRIYRTAQDWTVRQAMWTPQIWILIAAYFMHLLSGVTVASLSVAHLTQIGVAAGVAAAMLSLESLFAAGSRFAGGLIGDRLDPKHVLVISQAVTMAGLVALGSGSTSEFVLIIYAIGTGIGFGLTVLACSVLLINYFGRKNYLELFSIVCLAGAFAAAGPFIGGIIRDWTGSFALAFQIYAVIAGVVTIAALVMRPPIRRTETSAKTASSERGGNNVSNAKPA